MQSCPDSSFNGDSDTAQVEEISDRSAYWGYHSGYISLGDMSLDQVTGVRTPDQQQPWFLSDFERAEVVQEHESLNNPWSTHTVFAIEDNVGNPLHRDASHVDLWTQDQGHPNLDLIDEQDNYLQTSPSGCEPYRIVSKLSERQRRPQVVRDWLSVHASWPYPTSAEKSGLIAATGYTERQLNNCLSNVRTREKYCKPVILLFVQYSH